MLGVLFSRDYSIIVVPIHIFYFEDFVESLFSILYFRNKRVYTCEAIFFTFFLCAMCTNFLFFQPKSQLLLRLKATIFAASNWQ